MGSEKGRETDEGRSELGSEYKAKWYIKREEKEEREGI